MGWKGGHNWYGNSATKNGGLVTFFLLQWTKTSHIGNGTTTGGVPVPAKMPLCLGARLSQFAWQSQKTISLTHTLLVTSIACLCAPAVALRAMNAVQKATCIAHLVPNVSAGSFVTGHKAYVP